MPTIITPTEDQVCQALAAQLQLADPKALVSPRWIPIEEGDSPDDFRSPLDLTTDGAKKVHAILCDFTAPVESNLPGLMIEGIDPEDLPTQVVKLDQEWTYKIGVFLGHEQGNDTANSKIDLGVIVKSIFAQLAKKPKLGLNAHVKVCQQPKIVRVSWWRHSQGIAHVIIMVTKIKLYQHVTIE